MVSQIKQQGFTIVELLIVIVVIAILAALSYVGYTSITARANNSTAAATAKAVKDAAQTFSGVHGVWPANKLALTSGVPASGSSEPAVAKLPTDISFPATASASNQYSAASTATQALSGTTAAKTVLVYPCGSTGLRIYYKDFTGSTAKSMDAGDCSTAPAAATSVMTN